MKEKLKKFIYEFSNNSRISTKELGKYTNMSQQSASYLKSQLKKNNQIKFTSTIIDSVKLGFINILVGFNFIKLEASIKKEILTSLINNPNVTSIEEGKEGLDLIVEFCTINLAEFNKIHTSIISKFEKSLKTTFVFPIIIRHIYQKNYLVNKQKISKITLYKDRKISGLSKNETLILNEFKKTPDEKLINISYNLKIPVKTIIKIKKDLEKKEIIRGYTTIYNNNDFSINRDIIFIRFPSTGIKDINKFKDFAKFNKNIIEFTKLIGSSQVVITVESLKEIKIIKEIRKSFPIDQYLIVKSESIHKKNYLNEVIKE
ncbi:Lrp/AsnC family transcriptional regulator [Candidatus Pacearchaeota archaeon]|nr:Lrp/AsnC family transcriptional regulator [Candidatus Pacearchaeota archaeon]